MASRQFFFCSQRCTKYFKKESQLVQHRAHSTLCLARWNARLSAATSDLQKEPVMEDQDLYLEGLDAQSEDNEVYQSEIDEGSTSSSDTDKELELAPVANLENDNAFETLNHLGGPLGLNDPDLYDTESGYGTDADDGIWRQGAVMETIHDDLLDDDAAAESDRCPEVDESAESVVTELFPGAAKVTRVGDPPFSIFAQKQRALGHGNLHYPFAGPVEWGLARWLHGAGSTVAIDQFLKLKYVQGRPPSFSSASKLHDRIAQLPDPGTQWLTQEVIPGDGVTISPPVLFFKDVISVIESLMHQPSLAPHLEHIPRRIWVNEKRKSRIYNEIFTGDWAWKTQASADYRPIQLYLPYAMLQASLPEGAALIPVLLTSDKTHLTQFAGDKHAWPLYLSIGNIRSSIRNKPSNNAWKLIAYIPTATFLDPITGKKHAEQTTLQDRLFHQCLQLILAPLVKAGTHGIQIADSEGKARHSYPRLAAYLADYPEQLLINCAPAKTSSTTTARSEQFGDAAPQPPRTHAWVLSQIRDACISANPTNIADYRIAASLRNLNGVDKPFWQELPGYEPAVCVAPDILHGLLRFWCDHILKWILYLVGKGELSKRLRALQPNVGMRHFKDGVNSLSQWTGREDRELQRVILAVIDGIPKIDPLVTRCLRAMHDFLYLAQYRSHSDDSLKYLRKALKTFHSLKKIFIENGARRGKNKVIRHFRIPKLAALHSYNFHIPIMGASPQFSTEITETLHQTMAKLPYKKTNRKDFVVQMCRYLDRIDRIKHLDELVVWHNIVAKQNQIKQELLNQPAAYRQLALEMINVQNAEEESLTLRGKSSKGLIWHSRNPTLKNASVDKIELLYQFPKGGFLCLLQGFVGETFAQVDQERCLQTWNHVRIQLPTVQDENESSTAQTIQALPPSKQMPYGRCNSVLVHDDKGASTVGVSGYRVAQVRLFFGLTVPKGHPLCNVPLVYVHWFSKLLPYAEKNILMYAVKRLHDSNGLPKAGIIELASIARFIQLIPRFTAKVPAEVTYQTSSDICKWYLINSFTDKEIYQAVY